MNDTTSGIARYQTRRIEVDAIRWTGADNCEEVFAFLGLKHPDVERHELIDITSYGHMQTVEVGDWIVRYADGEHQAFSPEEFSDEFEAADDEPELGWDETVVHHPPINQLRIPLNHGSTDAGVLVLNDGQCSKLATEVLSMLAAGNPSPFTWGHGVNVYLPTGAIEIPVKHGNAWIGNVQLTRSDAKRLWHFLGEELGHA